MPRLPGFSGNAFASRDDVCGAALALLQKVQQYQSPGGARIRLPISTGAHFDEAAAQLEGFARPLWAVAALYVGGPANDETLKTLLAPFVRGLANGTDPNHAEFWGRLTGTDQRMVEMEILSFALLTAPSALFHGQPSEAKASIISWLRSINDHPLPATNWLWFRVMTNLALIKVCGLPLEELYPLMQKDLDHLDSFYLEDGWSSDGSWSTQGRQADYYSGSFAIQFSQLLYVKFAADIDPDRCAVFRDRAGSFATSFFLYFDQNGAAIPFGRSLTYRFAMAAFWAAAAYAEVELPDPLHNVGVVKGLLLRHLRWWAARDDMFNIDGTLSIGFAYPNMFMCEDYNSPQSVYWCMKTFIALALPDEHKFWVEDERLLLSHVIPRHQIVRAPMQIVCNSGFHHFLLSSGQFCPWPLKATEAKYGKFAYSSHFPFSVPTGSLIQQIAPDNTLALSTDGGDTWKVRWVPRDPSFGKAVFRTKTEMEEVPVLFSSWKPWPLLNVEVSTVLIAPSSRWPNWHIRVHRISMTLSRPFSTISAVEGGFAISGSKKASHLLAPSTSREQFSAGIAHGSTAELAWSGADGCCFCSADGVSGIRRLSVEGAHGRLVGTSWTPKAVLLKPDSNTNLMHPRTVIPTLQSTLLCTPGSGPADHLMAVGVFAATDATSDTLAEWIDPPRVHIGSGDRPPLAESYISLSPF